MFLLRREVLETAVIATTACSLSYGLCSASGPGCAWTLATLSGLAVLAVAQDLLSLRLAKWHSYTSRAAGSEGVALGALALPWTFVGLLVHTLSRRADAGFAELALHVTTASSAGMLAWLACQACLIAMRSRHSGHCRAHTASETDPELLSSNDVGCDRSIGASHLSNNRELAAGGSDAARQASSDQISRKGLTRRPTSQNSLTSIATAVPSAQNKNGESHHACLDSCSPAAHISLANGAPGSLAAQDLSSNSAPGANAAQGVKRWRFLAVACLVLLVALLAVPMLPGPRVAVASSGASGSAASLSAAINATASAGGMHLVLTHLPNCFTVGEAMVVAQALALLTYDVVCYAIRAASHVHEDAFLGGGHFAESSVISGAGGMQAAVAHQQDVADQLRDQPAAGDAAHVGRFVEVLVFSVLLAGVLCAPLLRSARRAHTSGSARLAQLAGVAILLLLGLLAALTPALWAVAFALSTWRRAALLGYWVALLAMGLPVMDWASKAGKVPTIIIRKGYHILALALFLPALVLEPQLLGLALGIAFALLTVLEVVRIGQVPWVGERIHAFMTSFIDSRDSGILLVSHFSLLVGMAVPIWLMLPALSPDRSAAQRVPVAAFAGIMSLGLADSAASVIGRMYGRHPICLGNKKTVEGTFSGILCTLLGWALLLPLLQLGLGDSTGFGSWLDMRVWGGLTFATTTSCLLEAATTQLDNMFIPLHYFAVLAASVG